VDIFNEGIDIPRINQIIMLRPTQSAIIFVQQLGRGLRKVNNKEYLTVIDFIGNYSNNYLVPVALYGDTTYNKDTLRNLLSTGSQLMPGSSTINFDKITKEKIFSAIDSANMQMKKDLMNDYKLLKFKLGRIPTLTDFIEHGSRDPYAYISYAKSYYNFVVSVEDDLHHPLNGEQQRLLAFFSQEINNAKRIEETVLLDLLLCQKSVTFADVRERLESGYHIFISEKTFASCIRNLNFDFVTQNHEKQMLPLSQIYGIHVVDFDGKHITMAEQFLKHLENEIFRDHLQQTIACALLTYSAKFDHPHFDEGFQLYRKYSRKDVFRILNWETNPVAQNVGGYIISPDKSNCPVFVNYHKHENISSTTKYEDIFLNNRELQWMSKSKRTLESSDVKTIRNYKNGLRIPLFIKKSNDEGTEFYYMGDVTPIDDSFEQTTLPTDDGKKVSVVKLVFKLKHPVEDHLYEYLTDEG
jgi:hypothetical protein